MKNELIQLTGVLLLSAAAAYLMLPRLIRFLKTRAKLDMPNHRSSHKEPTPTMGGISFFAGLIIALIFAATFESLVTGALIALAGGLGFWDDLKDLSPKFKFLVQALIATGFYFAGFAIAPLIELLFGFEIPFYLDWALTVFFMLGLINAFNLIDGVDGLLIGITLIASLTFSIIFYLQGQGSSLFISVGMVGVSLSFLIYNFQPAKIFMGDTGSLFIGAYISSSLLKVTESGNAEISIVAVSLILLACVDMLRLFLGRYLIRKKPFKADRNHIHHILLKIGWTHKKIVLHIYLFQLLLTLCALFFSSDVSFIMNTFILMCICVGIYGILQLLIYRKRQHIWKKTLRMRNERMRGNQLLKSYIE